MRIESQFNLKDYNSYGINAICRKAYFPDSESDMIYLLDRKDKLEFIGSGNNIILSKAYYDRDFVLLNGNFNDFDYNRDTHIIQAQSGVTLFTLSSFAREHGLTGLEMFYDIPSSIGGAVIMNAGAGGIEIKDILLGVLYYDLNLKSKKYISREELDFTYRNSLFQANKNLIILRVDLSLRKGDPQKIKADMESIKSARWKKQPRNFPNAGSVFKRPDGFYVGAIMDDLGLKGTSVGGAQISEKHGGFIVNKGNASGQDIMDLIDIIQSKVKDRYGFFLEVEQRII